MMQHISATGFSVLTWSPAQLVHFPQFSATAMTRHEFSVLGIEAARSPVPPPPRQSDRN